MLRRMRHGEHMRAVGTHDGPTRMQATPSEGRHSWHNDVSSTLSRSTPRRADDTTTRLRERADASVRRLGLGARLLAMFDEARAGYDLQFRQRIFLPDNQRVDVSGLESFESLAQLS